jgi:glycosyltransferase involved in cell wall biosynthesis
MRIVVLGGWALSLINFRAPLLTALVEAGHDVIAMAAQGTPEMTAKLAALGVRFEEVPLERAGVDPGADIRAVWHLVGRFRVLRPDAVLAYTIKPVAYGGLAARLAGIRHRFALITGLGYAFAPPRDLRHRVVSAIARGMYRLGLAGAELIFFQNPDDRTDFEGHGLVPSGARVEVVRGSGVDTVHYGATPLPAGPPVFLFIGRLLLDKGIREYVATAREVRRRHPEARFQMIGWHEPNPDSVSREELAGWQAEGAIEYLGAADDIRPAISGSHVIVLPSYREGTPRSVLEAMSMGRAVITTDVPGCRETIVDGEHGYLVPARSTAAIAAACERLVEAPQTIARLGQAGRDRAVALYEAKAVASHMLDAMRLA